MKKWVFYIVSMVVVFCITFSCKEGKSLQELLQEEKKAIDRFIEINDLVILRDYPADGVFNEKEFYKTNEGLFIHVVDSGNGTRVQLLNDVTIRYKYRQDVKEAAKGDSTVLNFYGYEPFSFMYGIPQTYSSYYSYICQAWVIPLAYVGEDAILDLLIPSSIGAADDHDKIIPVFYKNLHYTRFN